jgi:hypothetical protein
MQPTRRLLAVPLMVLLGLSTPAFAQQRHVINPDAIAAVVDQRVATQDADRAAIREALARPQVQDVAKEMGVDLGRVTASLDTLAGADLTRAAGVARQVNDTLAGGASTIVISTTTIIIILLVIILLIVALK